jgi:hypothetical protein
MIFYLIGFCCEGVLDVLDVLRAVDVLPLVLGVVGAGHLYGDVANSEKLLKN